MTKSKVGCYGLPGSFTYEAMESFFEGRDKEESYYSRFEDLVAAVKNGTIHYGVIPIENSSTGGITEVYDLIRRYDVRVAGEKCLPIEQYLMGLPGATLEGLREVYSHPQGFQQSRRFFRNFPSIIQHPSFSTSESAVFVKKKGDPAVAAVAGKAAARLYGLSILAGPVNTDTTNCTRFFILSNQEEQIEGADKITLVVQLSHTPGALYRALGCFDRAGLNLMNLESRPMEHHPFEYFFHIDVMGNLKEEKVQRALAELKGEAFMVRILGNYKQDGRMP